MQRLNTLGHYQSPMNIGGSRSLFHNISQPRMPLHTDFAAFALCADRCETLAGQVVTHMTMNINKVHFLPVKTSDTNVY